MSERNLRIVFFISSLLAGTACWTLIAAAAPQAGDNKVSGSYADGREIVGPDIRYMTSIDDLRMGGGCVDIRGVLVAGRFFFDLKRRMTADGPVFRVGHRTVTEFPDEVLLVVELTSGVPCSKGKPPGPAIPSLEALKSPRAEAVYIRDLQTHPLEINLSKEDNDLPLGGPPELREGVWHYQFHVKTKGVRLTDALVFTLFSKEGSKIAKLSWHQ